MSVTGDLGQKDRTALNYGISRLSAHYKVGDRLAAIGIDTSYRKYIALDDGAATHNCVKFGSADDELMYWDGTNFLITGATEVTGVVKISNQELNVGTFGSSAAGSGIPLDANSAAFRVYADDDGAAIGSGSFVRAMVGRNLLTYTGGNREQEAAGVVGQVVSVAGTNRHNMCGVMGSYEVKTSLVVDGQASSTDPWVQAAVIGRVGAGSAITTLNSNAKLCGIAAMSNTTSMSANSGAYCAFYAGRWASLLQWDYGIFAEYVNLAGYFIGSKTVTSEEHFMSYDWTPTLSSGDSAVGVNIAITTAGTAGTWVAGIFAKVTQGSTKNVNGYICGAEFEVVNTNTNVSAWFPLVLNSNSTHNGEHTSYIALRDYGTADIPSLFWAPDNAIRTTTDGVFCSTVTADPACTHAIRCIVGTTTLWIMATTDTPAN